MNDEGACGPPTPPTPPPPPAPWSCPPPNVWFIHCDTSCLNSCSSSACNCGSHCSMRSSGVAASAAGGASGVRHRCQRAAGSDSSLSMPSIFIPSMSAGWATRCAAMRSAASGSDDAVAHCVAGCALTNAGSEVGEHDGHRLSHWTILCPASLTSATAGRERPQALANRYCPAT